MGKAGRILALAGAGTVCASLLTLAATGCATLWSENGGGMVARTDYDANKEWKPKEVMGRGFWNTLHPQHLHDSYKTKMAEINKIPAVRDAAIMHFMDVLTPDKSNVIENSALEGIGKTLDRNPDVPHHIHMMASRPPYRCMREIRYDKDFYEAWKKKHPNFMSFTGGAEWDNEFIQGVLRGKTMENLKRVNASEETIANVKRELPQPKDRAEALTALNKCHEAINKYYFNDPSKISFIRSGWCLDHYAFEGGADMVWHETTNSGYYRHQPSFFFARGAAHQYDKKWGWFIALFHNGYDRQGKYLPNAVPSYFRTDENHSPGHGMSLSIYVRDMYLAYLSGASFVYHEGWMDALCKPKEDGSNVLELSPHGQAMKEWYEFTQNNKRGVSYVPVALLLPFDQGYPQWGGSPWSTFKYERPDSMIDAFMYTIAPYTGNHRRGLEGCLGNSPYGDIYDVILPGTTKGPVARSVLDKYKVAILLGKHNVDKALADRLVEYVRAGGTLVINTRQANEHFPASFLGLEKTGESMTVKGEMVAPADGKKFSLPEDYTCEKTRLRGAAPMLQDPAGNVMVCANNFGRGRVITTTVDYMVPNRPMDGGVDSLVKNMSEGRDFPFIRFILDGTTREVLPFEVGGDIEYGVNRLDDGWQLYLINNKGVTKYVNTAQELDASKTARVEVRLKSLKPSGVVEQRTRKEMTIDAKNNSFAVEVPPGDVRVVKIGAAK